MHNYLVPAEGDIPSLVDSLAKRVQDESLYFGCASALYGLTKLLYEMEKRVFDEKHSAEVAQLKSICLWGDRDQRIAALEAIEAIQQDKDNITLKFFYITFYNISPALQKKAKTDKLRFAAHLDTPEVFASDPDVIAADLQDNVYFITIQLDIMDEILTGGDKWTDERRAAKEEQRRLIAHEIAHQLFRAIDPDRSKGLDSEKNADMFAGALLRFRKYYIDGSPSFPRVKLDRFGLDVELKQYFSSQLQETLTSEIAAMPEWLETLLNDSDKGLISFDRADPD